MKKLIFFLIMLFAFSLNAQEQEQMDFTQLKYDSQISKASKAKDIVTGGIIITTLAMIVKGATKKNLNSNTKGWRNSSDAVAILGGLMVVSGTIKFIKHSCKANKIAREVKKGYF
tara:strand:+ start:2237 stop:2581 length:345 start_codon:yes stop_codon:yes gene_type:complete